MRTTFWCRSSEAHRCLFKCALCAIIFLLPFSFLLTRTDIMLYSIATLEIARRTLVPDLPEQVPVFEAVPSDTQVLVTLPMNNDGSKHLPRRIDDGQKGEVMLHTGPVPDGCIHFVITAHGALSPKTRELCAIESAAMMHPDKVVLVHFASPVIYVNQIIKELSKRYSNIAFLKLDIEDLFSDTMLSEWYKKSNIWNATNGIIVQSDLGRMTILHKYGGHYVDSDIVTLQRFTNIRNSVVLDSVNIVFNGNFLAFDKGHPFTKDYMEYVINKFKEPWPTAREDEAIGHNFTGDYLSSGPYALYNLIFEKRWCRYHMRLAQWLVVDRTTCRNNFSVLSSTAFQPVPLGFLGRVLLGSRGKMGATFKELSKNSYGLHLNNLVFKHTRIILNNDVVLTDVLKKQCPVTVQVVKDEM